MNLKGLGPESVGMVAVIVLQAATPFFNILSILWKKSSPGWKTKWHLTHCTNSI